MAEVWLAEHQSGRRAALKWLRPDASPAVRRGFEAEIVVLSRLDHPGIVHLVASGKSGGRPWFAMDVCDGADLLTVGEKLRVRPSAERHARARDVGVQLAAALGYLHRAGLVHRDVKPANVLWASGKAVLTDFGVVTAPGPAMEEGFVGSIGWASPEALFGVAVDARADQYGLGLVMYWLVTGARPFDEGRRANPHVSPRPPSERDPSVPADLEVVILRCIASDPHARYADMDAVAFALGAVSASEGSLVSGRHEAAASIVGALDRVAQGQGQVVRLVGVAGSGQAQLFALARASALRRDLACVVDDDPAVIVPAATRALHGEALLVLTSAIVVATESVTLLPLSVADIRRSIFAAAPATPELASEAERLRAWSGGLVDLVEAALRSGVRDGCFSVGQLAEPDLEPWLGRLDLDAASVAQALAALPDAAPADVIEAVAAAPAIEVLPSLVQLGIAVQIGARWLLGAEAFRAPLLRSAIDLDPLLERAGVATSPPSAPDPVLVEARAHLDAGRLSSALDTLVRAVGSVTPDAPPEHRLLLAALHWTLRDHAGAAEQWGRVRVEATDPRARARALIGLGVLHLQRGELDLALDELHHALTDAELAGDPRVTILAGVDLAEARALRGHLGDALRAGRRARDEARALRDGPLEAKAARAYGHVCLEVGLWREAEASLADAAALARAANLEDERLAVRALRAQAALDARPGDRVAAAVALDRLGGGSGLVRPDPEGFRALTDALRAEAQARLGEPARARSALAEALAATPPRAMALRLGLRLARVHQLLGERGAAMVALEQALALSDAHGFALCSWRARSALAAAAGEPAPEPGGLVDGLGEAERVALLGGGGGEWLADHAMPLSHRSGR